MGPPRPAESVSPQNLLEMQIVQPHPYQIRNSRSLDSDAWWSLEIAGIGSQKAKF